ncbi:hypothetical protein U0070_015029 [Myodes glareolus]|uniref:Uncharacterized protein n=1 Tax=Myodes glareolus TaxID=447135 RepID=A0AAW0HYG4_MYOGA
MSRYPPLLQTVNAKWNPDSCAVQGKLALHPTEQCAMSYKSNAGAKEPGRSMKLSGEGVEH